ncbi:hypothetical protein F511_27064 [Dorcoceras hygrometricum]|uniref:Triacylglycerol lipase n=1 Tax=Dorcoceras hygrometricum TaxID=472368 RepID=A0A2Z7CZ54_9LAMI|nr:hypothetical protein F511_27064 [Dorcoceras hygrometricum]
MVKRLATSPHDPQGITDSSCKNQLVMVSVQYGPFNTYIPIRSTAIGKSRVARDPITMHTSRRSNSDIACVTRVSMTFRVVRANLYNQDLGLIHSINGNHLESTNEGSSIDHQVTIHLHAQNITMFPTNETWYFTSQISCRVSMTFRVVRANLYNQDLGLIHSINGNHLESTNEGSSIDHQVTIHLHAQNITMFPTNETWYFTSQMLVSSSGGLILIFMAQSTRNEFRIHSDY